MEYTGGKWEAEWNEIIRAWVIIEQPGVGLIARCAFGKGYESNARLIAAAPRMAEWIARVVNPEYWVSALDMKEANEILQTLTEEEARK